MIRIVLTVATTMVVMLPLLLVLVNTFRYRVPLRYTPRDIGIDFQDVAFEASDGVHLAAWWLPVAGSTRTMIVCHGVGASREDALRFFPFLHQAGYNILSWDWRGHGASDAARVTFGLNEVKDVRAALDWLNRHHAPQSQWLGCLAISMGAGIVLQAAGECPQIKAYVLDSPWASLRSMLPSRLDVFKIPHALDPLFVGLTDMWCRVILGAGLDRISPIDHLTELAGRPVFCIHGTSDIVIPWEQTQILCAALERLGIPHECWIVPGVYHTGVREERSAEYHGRVLEFLAHALSAPRPDLPALAPDVAAAAQKSAADSATPAPPLTPTVAPAR